MKQWWFKRCVNAFLVWCTLLQLRNKGNSDWHDFFLALSTFLFPFFLFILLALKRTLSIITVLSGVWLCVCVYMKYWRGSLMFCKCVCFCEWCSVCILWVHDWGGPGNLWGHLWLHVVTHIHTLLGLGEGGSSWLSGELTWPACGLAECRAAEWPWRGAGKRQRCSPCPPHSGSVGTGPP